MSEGTFTALCSKCDAPVILPLSSKTHTKVVVGEDEQLYVYMCELCLLNQLKDLLNNETSKYNAAVSNNLLIKARLHARLISTYQRHIDNLEENSEPT